MLNFLQSAYTFVSVAICAWWDIYAKVVLHCGPWVILFFTICVVKHCSLPLLHAFVMKCRVYDIAVCLITIVVAHFSHVQYVHDSPAHLYIPQLFTHCLPTIICVALMFVMYVFDLTFVFVCNYTVLPFSCTCFL